MHLRYTLGLLLVFLSAFRVAAIAQTGGISISGYVRDELTQEAVSSAQVELRTQSGDTVGQSAVSGDNGEFRLATSERGDYYLTAERSGYQLASIPLGNLSQSNLVVLLRRSQSVHGSESRSAVSAHDLSVPSKARDALAKGTEILTKASPDYGRAISQFQRAIKACPTYYEAYVEMSIAQFRMGETQAAEESLRRAAVLSENHDARALALLAELLNSRNRFSEAESAARQAIAADERSWRGHCQLARALSGLKRPSEAESSARRALELDPGNPVPSLVLGNIHVQEHDYAAALRDFNDYLGRAPGGPHSDLVRKSRDHVQRILSAPASSSVQAR